MINRSKKENAEQDLTGQPWNDTQGADGDKPMSDSEVLAFCTNEVSRGIGGSAYGDEEEDVSLAYDYFYGRKPGISKAQQRDPQSSRYVSLDVMDAVEATVSEIFPTFTTDEIAFYEPENERDEKQSKTESDVVNYILFDECDGYSILQAALRDCLLNRNGTTKCYWDERSKVEYEEYEDVTEMMLFSILQPTSEGQEVVIVSQNDSDDECPMKSMMEDKGEKDDSNMVDNNSDSTDDASNNVTSIVGELERISSGEGEEKTFNITIKRTTQIGKPVIDAIQPEQVIVSGDHNKPTLYDVRFVAHEKIETQSSLIEQGFDPKMVDQLEDYNTNVESISRSRTAAEYDYFASDRSVRHIRVFECYALLDVDGDGIAERRKIVYAGGQLLSNDPWPSVSMVGGVTTAIAHKYKGLSLFDRMKAIQDSKTPVIRSIIDGTRLAANPRIGVVTGEVNIDDLLTSKVGGVVRAQSSQSIFEVPRAEVPPSAYQMLDLMDNMRRERGGSAIGTASQAQKLSNDSAHSFERTMASMEQSNALLARTFGETLIKGIFIEMHNLIRNNYQGEFNAKIGGKWVTTIPSEWTERTSVTVSIGASNAERLRQSQALQQVLGFQRELMQSGSTMIDDKRMYKTLTSAISLSGVKDPEGYFIDPESKEGQQASQGKQQQSEEAKKLEQSMQQAIAKAQSDLAQAEQMKGQAQLQGQQSRFEVEQMKAQIEIMQTQLDKSKDDGELAYKYAKLDVDESLKLTELEVTNNRELSKQHQSNKE